MREPENSEDKPVPICENAADSLMAIFGMYRDDWNGYTAMFLSDFADGVKGHYCIARQHNRYASPTSEYWNKTGWAGFGEVFYTKKAAMEQMRKINRGKHEAKRKS